MNTPPEAEGACAPVQCVCCGDELGGCALDVRDSLTGELFGVSACPSCGLGHTRPQPDELGRYYGRRYYGNRHGFSLRHCVRRRLGLVTKAVGGGAGRRLLDLGCGDGSFLLAAREAGWGVAGTELNPERARSAGLEVWDGLDLLPPEAAFDCVTAWHSLEHLRNPVDALRRIGAVLNPGGTLVAAVPDWGGWPARLFRKHWLHLDVPRHLFHFTDRALSQCLASAGFAGVRRWHQEFEYDLLGWSQSALNGVMASPNLFFDCLTGKATEATTGAKMGALALGTLLSGLFVPALLASTVLGRGGTLIAAAKLCPGNSDPPAPAGPQP